MAIFKNVFKGIKNKIFKPLGRFVDRNKKALITEGMIAGLVVSGGAMAGLFPSLGTAAGTTLASATAFSPAITTTVGTGIFKGVAAGAATTAFTTTGQALLGTGITAGLGAVGGALEGEDDSIYGVGAANRLVAGRNRGYGYA